MFKNLVLILAILPFNIFSQEASDSVKINKILDQVNVNALRASKTTPVAFTNISKDELKKGNLGQDLPYMISLTPSVVTTSDAGAGVGYTGFRIRGSDPTRINVTINGIPLNDSESQGVWWVNMPDFTSSIENIQIQRGVGTSTNGAGAFGASVNLMTNQINKEAYLTTNNSFGSFSTLKNNVEFGTGILNNKFSFAGRLSKITSDGYIDRATSNLKSLYLQGSYIGEKSILKAIMFGGKEITYQAWNGVPLNYLEENRTYNAYNYENEVDNYEQTHYQLHYKRSINNNTKYNLAAHYTHGEGYYEQEKLGQNLTDYGLSNIILSNDTISTTDLIRRKWLNNDFTGLTYSLNHDLNNISIIIGGAYNEYDGKHYGRVIWAQYASNSEIDHQYYWNKGVKIDNNYYAKVKYKYLNSSIYVDLQRRIVDYQFEGLNNYGDPAQQEVNHSFFNPKFGIHHSLTKNNIIYASFSVANKEPNRSDYIESSTTSRPKPETLYDTEIGYKSENQNFNFGINLYSMDYDNQLVMTGQINDVGARTRFNVEESYRRGIEIEGASKLTPKLFWSANLTFSENKIVSSFIEDIDNWDTWGTEQEEHKNTDLAFSPNLVWASQFTYHLNNYFNIDFISKYVGEQYIDNTSSDYAKLDDYFVHDFRMNYSIKSVEISAWIRNLFNQNYISNAWVYRFNTSLDPTAYDPYANSAGGTNQYNQIGAFNQAGINFFVGVKFKF